MIKALAIVLPLSFVVGCAVTPANSDSTGTVTQAVQPEPEVPSAVTYAVIYSDANGDSHFRDDTVPMVAAAVVPPAEPLALSPVRTASRSRWGAFHSHWGEFDRDNNIPHPASVQQWVAVSDGKMTIRVSDGEERHFRKGDILLVADTKTANPLAKGHVTWAAGEEVYFHVTVDTAAAP